MKYQHPETVILIFAKAPEEGKVKTRLIPALGKRGACELYKVMAGDIIQRLASSKLCPVILCCQPDTNHEFFVEKVDSLRLVTQAQRGANIGDRMQYAIDLALQKYQQAIVIGTDCPEYSIEYIEAAIEQLQQTEVVIGPAFDGGYVLIGMRQLFHGLFENIIWSEAAVLESTLRNAERDGISCGILDTLHDIDHPDDLKFIPSVWPYKK